MEDQFARGAFGTYMTARFYPDLPFLSALPQVDVNLQITGLKEPTYCSFRKKTQPNFGNLQNSF